VRGRKVGYYRFMDDRNFTNNFLGDILRALGEANTPPPRRNALADLLNLPPPQAQGLGGDWGDPNSAFGSLFGMRPKPAPPPIATPIAPRVRRVFYSFHYADVNRVNQVRQSGKIRPIDSERVKTIQDRSLWERKKSINDDYLRRAITKNIVGTSVTCVLTGRDTWERPWCRFEIARSLLNGNGIFAVRIDHLYCIGQRCYGTPGPNPLDHMAVGLDQNGRIQVYEHVDGGWYVISTMTKPLPRWPKWLEPVPNGYVRVLSSGAPIYDYESGDGARLLLYWANQAARAAGR
jgi:hypothetical protein